MRALLLAAVKAFEEGHKENAHRLGSQLLERYVAEADFGEADLDVLDVLVNLFEACQDNVRILASVRHQARILGWTASSIGERYFRSLHASNSRAQFSDFCMSASPVTLGKTIMIACMPKSGSTFLHSVMMQATGYSGPKLCLSYANEENMLSPEFVRSIYGVNKIAQEHCRAMPHNLAIMQAYDMDVVVLVRNIFDSLVSLRDMLLDDTSGPSMALFQNGLSGLSVERQFDAVISKWAHWQLDFYVSWVQAFEQHRISGTIWTYEALMADKPASIKDILEQTGHDITLDQARDCVASVEADKIRSRLNVGISGRGRSEMSQSQIDAIQSLTTFYPGIDFAPLGLG